MPEIAHHLTDLAHDGEGVGVVLHDAGKGSHLGIVDHAHDNADLPPVVHTLGRKHRSGVVELFDDLFAEFLRGIGDDFKPDRAAAVFQEPLRHIGGGEAVENAQQHRLHLVIIDKVAGNGHHGIHSKAQTEHTFFRVFAVNDGCHKIRTAGVGAGLDQNGIEKAHDDAGRQRSQNPAGAVFRGIGKGGKIHPVQHQKTQGENHDIHHASHRQGPADLEEYQNRQGDIDHQAEIAHADTADILDHGADAVDPRRGELVGKHEKLIVESRQHCRESNDKIGPNKLNISHFSSFSQSFIEYFFKKKDAS